jgi:uncharacterized membrane protein
MQRTLSAKPAAHGTTCEPSINRVVVTYLQAICTAWGGAFICAPAAVASSTRLFIQNRKSYMEPIRARKATHPVQSRLITARVVRLHASQRLAIASAAGGAAFLLVPHPWGVGAHFLVTWDVGATVYLCLAWSLIANVDAGATQRYVKNQDSAAYIIFLLVLTAALASTVVIAVLLGNVKAMAFWPKLLHLALSGVALAWSWLLIHTLYTFHYARRFYARRDDADAEPRGLAFPGTGDPDYFDFAYYAFVVAMTSQVSDVAVTAHHMRRLTLAHGLLSFAFNIAVLALTINLVAGVI